MNDRYARLALPCVLGAVMATPVTAARPAAVSRDCPSSSRPLRVHVVNGAAALPRTLDTAIEETTAIWATAGIRLTWTFPPASLDPTDNKTVVVMIQRGLKRPVRDVAASPLLGLVPFGERGPGSLIEVSFDAITSLVMSGTYLNRPVARLPALLQQVLLGRGLGRVVAHEIGHWLAGQGHMPDGLMRPAFGDRDLVDWNAPSLPRAWTAAGADALMDRFSRCEPPL